MSIYTSTERGPNFWTRGRHDGGATLRPGNYVRSGPKMFSSQQKMCLDLGTRKHIPLKIVLISGNFPEGAKTWNWEDVLDEVRAFSVGLSELGIKPGDKVAIVGDNRPRL